MEIDRQRIQDDLRGIVRGDVLCDEISTALYSTDASIYEIRPIAVVRPRTDADVVALVQYANDHDLPIHARGSGSGVAGESVGPGIVVDFSRFMRSMRSNPDDGQVTAQCGLPLAELNHLIKPEGRWFGPDPATRSITTIGGVLATNSSGSHYLRSGSVRDNIESIGIVTAEGERLLVGKHSPREEGTAGRLARGLTEIAQQYQPAIEELNNKPPARSGFRFDGVIGDDGRVDLAKFLVGTQGTLALFVEGTLKTEWIPRHRGIVVLFFHRLESASRTALKSLKYGPVACDLMGRRLLGIAREIERQFEAVLPREAEAMLLLEFQAEEIAELQQRLDMVAEELSVGSDAAFFVSKSSSQHERDQFWTLVRRATPRLSRLKGPGMPIPFIEDIAVPPERLPDALSAIQRTLRDAQCTATIFAHAGHGQLHVRPFIDLAKPADREKIRDLSEQVAEVVWRYDGQVSVEHAAGLSRSFLLPKQFGPFWPAMGQIKRLFDPHHRLNPGKLFGAVLQQPNENLRPIGQTIQVSTGTRTLLPAADHIVQAARLGGHPVPDLPVLQHWTANHRIDEVAQSCNGCARCRTTASGERQCPVFRTMRDEESTPRAKANLLRAVLSGAVDIDSLAGEKAKSVADLCFHCHQCRLECPASVDIPKIVSELKAQYVQTNGLKLTQRLLTRLDFAAAVAAQTPLLSNFLIRNRFFRWLMEATFGLSSSRELPTVASVSFMRHASRRRLTKRIESDGPKVVYFVDYFANYHDPTLGLALVEILQQNGIAVYVPTTQSGSGMARIAAGDLKGARRVARWNVRMLADAVRSGYHVIATEPAAVLCLRHESPSLLDDEDSLLVAKNSSEACEYLRSLDRQSKLDRSFKNLEAEFAYHRPCHLRVLDPDPASLHVLKLIPGLDVQFVDKGCSGMAGVWGLERKNYRSSVRIGWPMIQEMRRQKASFASTECSACKMQIDHGSFKTAVHPIKLLAYAYGRMPQLAEQLGLPPLTEIEEPVSS